jgi:hypothetical protein
MKKLFEKIEFERYIYIYIYNEEFVEHCLPLYLPISLTIPIPFSTLLTSTCAALMALWASSTAVSNPKDLSIT